MATSPRLTANILTGVETPDVVRDLNALVTRLEAVAALWSQGTLGSRPAASASNAGTFYRATDVGRPGIGVVYFSTGTAWIIPEPLVRNVTSLTSPGFSPVDGDVVEFGFTHQNTHAVYWRLRYVAANALKWLPQGCAPITVVTSPGSPVDVSGGTTTIAASIDLFPAPGTYRIHVRAVARWVSGPGDLAVTLGMKHGGLLGNDLDYAVISSSAPGGLVPLNKLYGTNVFTIATAGEALDITAIVTGGTARFGERPYEVTLEPLELGA